MNDMLTKRLKDRYVSNHIRMLTLWGKESDDQKRCVPVPRSFKCVAFSFFFYENSHIGILFTIHTRIHTIQTHGRSTIHTWCSIIHTCLLSFIHGPCHSYMAPIIHTWLLLLIHGPCHSYMAPIIHTWLLLFIHGPCHSCMAPIIYTWPLPFIHGSYHL